MCAGKNTSFLSVCEREISSGKCCADVHSVSAQVTDRKLGPNWQRTFDHKINMKSAGMDLLTRI